MEPEISIPKTREARQIVRADLKVVFEPRRIMFYVFDISVS